MNYSPTKIQNQPRRLPNILKYIYIKIFTNDDDARDTQAQSVVVVSAQVRNKQDDDSIFPVPKNNGVRDNPNSKSPEPKLLRGRVLGIQRRIFVAAASQITFQN